MKKIELWKEEHEERYLLISQKEIYLATATYELGAAIIEDVEPTTENIDTLNAALKTVGHPDLLPDEEDTAAFFAAAGYPDAKMERASYIEAIRPVIIYDGTNGYFSNLEDWDHCHAYTWHDGSNWRTVTTGDETDRLCLTISDSYIDLDEWDGSNHQTGGRGLHQRVHRIIEMDDRESTEPTYLLNYWSQWQGDHETGEVMTLPELTVHLQELGRDLDKYLPQIAAL